jgi:hypothetical protein
MRLEGGTGNAFECRVWSWAECFLGRTSMYVHYKSEDDLCVVK